MLQALEVSDGEARRRMRAMRRRVRDHDVERWASSFLGTLGHLTSRGSGRPLTLTPAQSASILLKGDHDLRHQPLHGRPPVPDSNLPSMRYVGARLKRVEDPRLLTGQGRYFDDLQLPGIAHATSFEAPSLTPGFGGSTWPRPVGHRESCSCSTGRPWPGSAPSSVHRSRAGCGRPAIRPSRPTGPASSAILSPSSWSRVARPRRGRRRPRRGGLRAPRRHHRDRLGLGERRRHPLGRHVRQRALGRARHRGATLSRPSCGPPT